MKLPFAGLILHWNAAPVAYLIALFAVGALSAVTTRPRHSLFHTAISWSIVCILCSVQTGIRISPKEERTRRLCLLAGIVVSLSHICERAASDREGVGWTRSVLPLVVFLILRLGSGSSSFFSPSTLGKYTSNPDKSDILGRASLYLIATGASAVILSTAYIRTEVTVLGLCSTILAAVSLVLFEFALKNSLDDNKHVSVRIIIRDIAAVITVSCLIVSFAIEGFQKPNVATRPTLTDFNSWGTWNSHLYFKNLGKVIAVVLTELIRIILIFSVTRLFSSLHASLIIVGSAVVSHLAVNLTFGEFWFTLLYASATFLLFNESQPPLALLNSPKRRMRLKQLTAACAALSFTALFCSVLRNQGGHDQPPTVHYFTFPYDPPTELLGPLQVSDTRTHPVDQLIRNSESGFESLLDRQSKTLTAAVAEYRRRYGIPPPPKFDIWYEFAKRKGVQLIDEFDNIHHSLLPFWGLEPSVIRNRAAEAIGYDNFLIAVLIRDGQVAKVTRGQDWQQEATVSMMDGFVQHLPDMDLAFNTHDEPRVVVPHDVLSQLLSIATEERMPKALANPHLSDVFSPRPADMSDGKHIKEFKTTRFNRFAHQNTWSHSRASCPPDSPARNSDDSPLDNITSYAYGELGFVYNHTAFSDICVSPSLRENFGFFDRPNAFDVVLDLFPIFSQSKISSFQDILYPSPWYWANKVEYQSKKDKQWSKKESKLYWRGSTTGGYSREGGWRHQHRQRVVRKMNAPDSAKILQNRISDGKPNWQSQEVRRRDFGEIIDIKFSHVGQCDEADCEAQREFFNVVERVDQQDAWGYRYLLDMDGNAFSGRFYAFLKSNSLVFKMSVFQEWHMEWLKPWVHYIPLSLIGDEWVEVTRYFAGEESGKKQGPKLAKQGQDWAAKALRHEDIEVWFFRLLLEYGRLIDDNRERIGFTGA